MRRLTTTRLVFLGTLIGLFCIAAQGADDKKDRDARRIQLLEQRFDQERTQLQADKAALQKKVSDQEETINSLRAAGEKTQAELDRVRKDRAAAAAGLSEMTRTSAESKKQSAQELSAKMAELEQFTKARQQERMVLNARLDAQATELKSCSDKNERLMKVAQDILQAYRNKDVWDAMKQKEPVLGIGETELFSQVQDFRDHIDAEHFVAPRVDH